MMKQKLYGRVALYVPKHKPRKRKFATPVVSYFFDQRFKPFYTYGATAFLTYESNEAIYEVYNPQKIDFELGELKAYIVNVHRYQFSEVVRGFEVVVIRS